MRAILVHGMGRTPLSMLPLAARLRRRGIQPALFGYSAAFESFGHCSERLRRFIDRRVDQQPFVLIGHSLGTVLLRTIYRTLSRPPAACFFIAPPTRAGRAARMFASRRLFKLATGEMGQLLADPAFMEALPVPECPICVYVGTAGPVGKRWPFGDEANDGVLSVQEATIPGIAVTELKQLHTFIMNAKRIADDVARVARPD